MFGKRCYTRGNVAVAALLFVTAVGAAAVALDSARIAQNPRAQLAQVGSDKAATSPKNDGTTCVRGFDYLIKLDSEKKPVVYATKTGQEKDAIKLPDGNQCPNTSATVSARGKIPPRQCTDAAWRCYVTFCKPKGFTGEALKQQECIFIDKAIPVGKPIDKQQAAVDSGFSKDVATAALSGNQAERNGAMEFKSALPSAMQTNLDSAFREVQQQEQKVETARTNYEEAFNKLTACQQLTSVVCREDSYNKARAELEAEQAKLNNLRTSAQSLGGIEKTLDTPPSRVPEVTTCVKDASGNCTRDERTNQGYRPPSSTIPERDSPSGDPRSSSPSSGGDWMKMLGQALPLLTQLLGNSLGGGNAPTCNIQASPKSVSRAGQPVTLSWTTQGAQSAYLSNGGQVGPTGSITVNPQQTTTYSMQVIGYPQQQQQQGQQQGQFVYNPYTGQYQYVQAQQQQQPAMSAPQQGQCSVQVKVGEEDGEDGDKPKAQISCQPKIVDVGMSVSISFACQNGAVASKGEGFSTDDKMSGSATTTVTSPGTGSTSVTYGLTCSKEGVTDSAQCTVNVNKPSIVLVANPRDIEEGDRTTIGWVTGAMEKCVISSPDLDDFTEENEDNTSVSGSVRTPSLENDTKFVLTCTTKAGGTKTAEVNVDVD